MLKKLPIGIQDFEDLRTNDYLYIDKTALIHKLIKDGKYYFLSRPRRFGKSLLMSTLHAYFSGKKELFKGLAMESLEKEWIEYPVLHLDYNAINYRDESALAKKIEWFLSSQEAVFAKSDKEKTFGQQFEGVIRRICEKTGRKVVILVDEYDKPILETIGYDSLQNRNCETLKDFYGALKSAEGYIKFVLITGVTKFGKMGFPCDLNCLNDISMDLQYNDICGITADELKNDCSAYVENLAQAQELSLEQTYAKLRQMYDGYHFHPEGKGIYNPFGLLNVFSSLRIGNFWFCTGTPTYLVELLQQHDYNLEKMSREETEADMLNSTDVNSTNPIPVIYQSGYLTIKGYNQRFGTYTLGFPNKEVEQGFLKFLLPYYANMHNASVQSTIRKFVTDIESGNAKGLTEGLRSFFAGHPYELIKDSENYYQNIIFCIFRLLGYYVKAEEHTSYGRIDLLLQSRDYTYIIELKHGGSAKEALKQIKDKEYDLPYRTDSSRKLILIGMNIDPEKRNINEVEIEQ